MEEGLRKAFRAERKRQQLNQTEVAKKAGIGQSTISKIETDSDYNPSLIEFQQAVAGLGMDLATFFVHIAAQSRSDSTHDKAVQKGGLPHDRAVSSGARAEIANSALQLKALIAVGQTIAESIKSMERTLERSLSARTQTAPARTHSSVRRRRR
jgi:transcriptional regulator with XRE-family HTH domain